jgi:fermentation-respiration switch protein FrsA (DUF1100 family)/alkylhydroperoxidase/carboxymuconolactone decarboxylase family protein YurZ
MKRFITKIIMGITALISFSSSLMAQNNMITDQSLSAKQQSTITISSFTAKGDRENLNKALNEGLDAGLTINEIKEILVQLYAYTGFPRSLNGLNTFMVVLDERKQKGINDTPGKEANPLPTEKSKYELGTEVLTELVGAPVSRPIFIFAPAIDRFLKEHLFSDIFGRDNLDYQSREIATISALASLGGVEGQLRSHLRVGMNVGLTEDQIRSLIAVLESKIGWMEGHTAKRIFNEIINQDFSNVIAQENGVRIQRVTFPNRNIAIVGNLHLPAGFDENKKYPAIIVGHPAGGVKEQTAGLYAQDLAEQGYITLAFDASYQGESGGEPRFLEDPAIRVEDFRATADYLSIHPSVDENSIGVLGICAGGGFAIKAAQTDHRLKAVATVSMVDLGQLRRDGIGGVLKPRMQQRLDEAAKQRTKEAKGEPVKYANYVANSQEEIPAGVTGLYREGYDYYRTPRAQHPNSANKYMLTSLDKLMGFTALDHVEMISPRPLLVIAGGKADSFYFSQEAYDKAKEPKEIFKVDGASHIDLYDRPQFVEPIVKKLTDFFGKNLE